MSDLLPPNSTPLTRTRARLEARIGTLDAPIDALWDPWRCPLSLLPWLAWAVGVEEWDASWPEQTKRQTVAAMLSIRWRRGTVYAVREALRAAGYGDAIIAEGFPHLRYDGAQLYDGMETHVAGARWALFKVIADIGEHRGIGGNELRRLLHLIEMAKPVRSHLREVQYRATIADSLDIDDPHTVSVHQTITDLRPAGRRYDGAIRHNQALQLPRVDSNYDGAYAYNAWLRHDGLTPHHEWDVIGERYDSEWEGHVLRCEALVDDTHVAAVRYDHAAAHEGAVRYGAGSQPCTSTSLVSLRWRRKHNGRLRYDAAHAYAGNAAVTFAL